MMKKYQSCPLCNCQVEYSNIYPHHICNDCISKAVGPNGEPVIFFHAVIISKDIQGYYRRNRQLFPFEGKTCYIKNVKCFATYDAGVGIIVQPVYEDAEEQKAGMEKSGKPGLSVYGD